MTLTEPLRFEPILLEKVWGGRALAEFLGTALPAEGPVGEVWSLVDRDDVSSVVATGAYAGRTLRGLMLSEREALLGRTRPAADGSFPLLVKYLDAGQPLSVQVHPDARAAEALRGGAEAKTECWYVLAAAEGAHVHLGFREDVQPPEIGEVAGSPEFCRLLARHDVHAGDFILVPAGTVHAIGGGVTLVEVQQNSDTTFRLYDWDRVGLDGKPRDLHVAEALRAIDYEHRVEGPVRPEAENPDGLCPVTPLVDVEPFAVRRVDVGGTHVVRGEGLVRILVVLEGEGHLSTPSAPEGESRWHARRGETWLLPACLPEYHLDAADGELSVLDVETRS